MMADNNDDDGRPAPPVTESTPLILRRSTVHTHLLSRPHPLPPLTRVINRIRLHGIQTVDEAPSSLFPPHFASLSQQIAFKMIVFSRLYILAKTPSMGRRTDVWEQWSGERAASLDAEDLQRRVMHIWEEFLEVNRSTQEIEECLWSPFALKEDRFHTVRGMSSAAPEEHPSHCPSFSPTPVVDVLKDHDAPHALVSHRLITLSISHTWMRGRAITPASSFFRRSLQRFRSVATPRCVEPTLLKQCS